MITSDEALCVPVIRRITRTSGVAWEIETKRYGVPSTFGTVWQACKDTSCQYVLKYMPVYNRETDIHIDIDDIVKEITLTKECADIGLCPTVYDSWLCPTGGAMVMKKLTATYLWLLRFLGDTDRRLILGVGFSLLKVLHDAGYYHGDLHLNNIMIEYDEASATVDRPSTFLSSARPKYFIIDMGSAGRLSDATPSAQKFLKYIDYTHLRDSLRKVKMSKEEVDYVNALYKRFTK